MVAAAMIAVLVSSPSGFAASANDEPTPGGLLGHRFAQIARQTLRGGQSQSPEPARVEQAVILLEQAVDLRPTDPELRLMIAEAAGLAEDEPRVTQAISAYLKLRPSDDAAWLRLIRRLARRHQTLDGQLKVYQRFLNTKVGRSFGPALRSRIAGDSASLELQRGEFDRHARLTMQALGLDPTNKAAAADAYRIMLQREDSRRIQVESLLTWFHADPGDPATRRTMARTLLDLGAYELAQTWYVTAANIQRWQGERVSPEMISDWAICLWATGRTADAVGLLTGPYRQAAQAAAQEEAEQDGQADDPDQALRAERDLLQRMPLDLQALRLAILSLEGKDDLVARGFDVLMQSFNERLGEDGSTDLRIDRAWVHLLLGRNLADAEQQLNRLAQTLPEDSAVLRRLNGWLHLNREELESAKQLLKPLAGEDVLAGYGLAHVHAERGEMDAHVERLRQVYRRAPGTMVGAMAAYKLRRAGDEPTPGPDAAAVVEMIESVPSALVQWGEQPAEVALLKAEVDQYKYVYCEPMRVELELRNTSSLPLPLGPEGGIPTRVMLMPTVSIGSRQVTNLSPVVVDLDRRLRLTVGQSLRVTARVDAGDVGAVLANNPANAVSVNCTAVLNPVLSRRGVRPGYLGSTASLPQLQRLSMLAGRGSFERLIDSVGGADRVGSMQAAATLARVIPRLPAEQAEQKQTAVARLTRQFDDLEAVQQAWVVSHLPTKAELAAIERRAAGEDAADMQLPAEPVDDPFAALREKAGRVDEPRVRLMLLAVQVQSPDAPQLNAAMRDSPGPLRRFAELRRDLLGQQAEQVDAESD